MLIPWLGSIIWVRLTTWKFPLFQLIAQFPRPPLGLATQFFVMAHLLGDPIDTIKNLLQKLSKCQSRAESWKSREPLVIDDIRLEGEAPGETEVSPIAELLQIHKLNRGYTGGASVSQTHAKRSVAESARNLNRVL